MKSVWIKASKSANGGQCVEMRMTSRAVLVRDSKAQGSGPTLTLAPSAFLAWIQQAKKGAFDVLV